MLYIHIPFCKSRCTYCNFFSTTKLKLAKQYVAALLMQLEKIEEDSRKNDKKAVVRQRSSQPPFSSIYIGGGTPSVLPEESLGALLEKCRLLLKDGGEFTIECNPDDLTQPLASLLYNKGVNRVSLGIQTFSDERLRLVNRRHTANKACEAVSVLRDCGIKNVSIDLMYGFPDESLSDWQQDVAKALTLSPEHISAYCLTVEEGTPLYKSKPDSLPSDELAESMYNYLCEKLKAAGYEHYEISNFCKPGKHSRHNSGYWQDKPYLALGAGAHGYNATQQPDACRYWNIANVEKYIANVMEERSVVEGSETITQVLHYNDLITTAMRTSRGLDEDYIRRQCGDSLANYFMKTAVRLAQSGLVEIKEGNVRLSPRRLFVSDDILSEFVFLES